MNQQDEQSILAAQERLRRIRASGAAQALEDDLRREHGYPAASAEAESAQDAKPLASIETEVAAMLSRIKPTDERAYRRHVFNQDIIPELRAAGFDERYWKLDLFAGVAANEAADASNVKQQAFAFHSLRSSLGGNGSTVCMVGSRGTGKTTIASQLAQEWMLADSLNMNPQKRTPARAVLYRKLTDLIARMKPYYGDMGTTRAEQIEGMRARLIGADLLIIDALEEGNDEGKYKDKLLTDLIDSRYSKRRDTVLISNQTREQFQATANPSILSRMTEHGRFIRCEWNTFRTPNQEPQQPTYDV